MDKLSYKLTVFINTIALTTCFAMMILYSVVLDFSFGLACCLTLTMGIQDAGINCLLHSLLGFQFTSKTTPFSVFRFIESLLIFVSISVCSLLNSASQTGYIVFFCVSYVFAVSSWIFLYNCFNRLTEEEVQALIDRENQVKDNIEVVEQTDGSAKKNLKSDQKILTGI